MPSASLRQGGLPEGRALRRMYSFLAFLTQQRSGVGADVPRIAPGLFQTAQEICRAALGLFPAARGLLPAPPGRFPGARGLVQTAREICRAALGLFPRDPELPLGAHDLPHGISDLFFANI